MGLTTRRTWYIVVEMKGNHMVRNLRWRMSNRVLQFGLWLMPRGRAKDDYTKALYDVKYKIIALVVD